MLCYLGGNTNSHRSAHKADKTTNTLTVVGAWGRVFGAGLADDVLVNLVPFVLIVTPEEQESETLY